MIRRIEFWLAGIIRAELQTAVSEIRADILKVKHHVSAESNKPMRLACALCGQMSWKYESLAGKTVCSDCRAKGRE